MNTFLKQLLARDSLTQPEAASLLNMLLAPDATDAQIAAILTALAAKGETAEELAGFAQTMRAHSASLRSSKHPEYIDTCGTGGSPVKTFNVSTAAAFIVSAVGLPVAKHGNVGVTSKIGSADVLLALGVRTDLTPVQTAECFEAIGMCFMFAPLHHPATKRVAMIRRELGVRTIFNLLGPLTNPAGAPFQVVGVSDQNACERVALALSQLGTSRSWIVRGNDGLDEITLETKTTVFESSENGVRKFEIGPEDFGLQLSSLANARGTTSEENADMILSILQNRRKDAALDLVLINAAAALFVAGVSENLRDAVALARQAIETGRAIEQLEALRDASQRLAQ